MIQNIIASQIPDFVSELNKKYESIFRPIKDAMDGVIPKHLFEKRIKIAENTLFDEDFDFVRKLRDEVRNNLITLSEFETKKYFHYLLKILDDLFFTVASIRRDKIYLEQFIEPKKIRNFERTDFTFENLEYVIVSAMHIGSKITQFEHDFYNIISYEFGISRGAIFKSFFENTGTAFNKKLGKEVPFFKRKSVTIEDINSLFNKDLQQDEKLVEYEFKSKSQQIAWLYHLGILDKVLELFPSEKGGFNFNQAALVISTFCDINKETIRRCLEAIYKPNESNAKNNPLKSKENKLFVDSLKLKFKID